MPCQRPGDCLEDKAVEVSVVFSNLDAAALSDGERAALGAALAGDLAAACDAGEASVVDARGASAAVTLGPGGRMEAFVRARPWMLDAQELAARLYSASFRATLGNTTAGAVGWAAGVRVASVSLRLRAHAPVTTTATATSPPTSPATTAAPPPGGTAAPETTRRNEDFRPAEHSGEGAAAAPAWMMAVLLAVATLQGGIR